jgi:hypothetical protein
MRHKILINCSNLHSGGGVAVASSFIDCLSHMNFEEFEINLLLSSSVHRNLKEMGTDINLFSSCLVVDYYGMAALWQGLDRHFRNVDLVFTVFGPAYFLFSRTLHIFGFAQPNIIYPNNPIAARSNFFSHLLTRTKYKIQECFFSRTDAIIVELEHVERGLKKLPLFENIPMHVVYSSVHSIYKEHEKWVPITLPKINSNLKLGVISRNYPHKNLAILNKVKICLWKMHNLNVDIYVTFQPNEWSNCNEEFRQNIINVGGLSLSQCPSFYSAMDGVIFPSLLECFSAVPIETMMIKKPLFASNLSFIHDVCGSHCNYFNPLDVCDISRVIYEYFNLSVAQQKDQINLAYEFVQKYPGPFERAKNYMSIINDTLKRLKS